MSLTGKVFLITGATKGIGAAVTRLVISQGASVVLSYQSDKSGAESFVSSLELPEDSRRKRVLAIQADASSLPDIDRLVTAAVTQFGHIDVVMPNAGTMSMLDLEHVTPESYDTHFNLNTKGPLFLVQKSVPYMPPGSRVIFVSTGVTSLSSVMPGYLLYAATKAAVEQFTRVLSKDLGRKGISVNCVAPGPCGTELFYRGKTQEVLDMISNQSPFRRVGTPEEVAGVVAFLAVKESSWVSGQVIGVNGANMV
ncbi:hypothetical protein B0H66DRAFT_542480 [Apodospora peruviana]|uniref:NAD(P)-binding protein n=1 Tax=Apodospora peruviana TaxID=516989 RepID=A0AAE0ISW7_9PEZI|nr:hypothetical protein B0H66DRAFT_542480 [Apodospora peruviana]